MFKTFKEAKISCPVVFSEKISAVFLIEKFQIDIENDTKDEILQFLNILCNFCQIFDRFRGLEY